MTEQLEHQAHEAHEHTHGEGCGHVAVPHVDHTDYVHDGHLHRVHDGHVDECEATDGCFAECSLDVHSLPPPLPVERPGWLTSVGMAAPVNR